nr:SH3 domain-containing kinase-binding protein 1 isoform X2 [Ciona intestinalis]|eukprot:XP_018670077.1 SH3 domain-containing kinase-binding protein 1 isoform X2 [Ciona intestinalis]
MATMKGIVQFDYEAEAPDELTLRVGDVIINIKNVEEGWCQGTLAGKVGMFPDNFVKIIEEPVVKSPVPTKKTKVLRRVKVTFDYEPINEDELHLVTGEIVDVYHDEEEGWARGGVNGKEGVFPTNFTTVVTETQSNETPPPKPEESHGSKKVKGVGFGNIFGDGPIKLRSSIVDGEGGGTGKITASARQQKVEKSQPKVEVPKVDKSSVKNEKPAAKVEKSVKNADKVPLVPPQAKKPAVEKCRAMFDYSAENDDELTLVKGDIVIILDKVSQDVGWWEGEIVDENGKRRKGVFPDNFVTPLPTVDEDTSSEETSSKDSLDIKTETKATKQKTVVEEEKVVSSKTKTPPLTSKSTNSLKRPAPQVPPIASQSNKPETSYDETDSILPNAHEEPKLTHYKRPGGPKNRRKPDTTGRRERAKESAEEMLPVPDTPTETEPVDLEPTEPTPPPKKDTKRGIQVMPVLGAEGGTGDTPSWLKNLKHRSSQKKPTSGMAVSPNKEEEPAQETPNWRNNLKKTTKQPLQPPKPTPQATSPKPVTSPMVPKQSAIVTSPHTNHAPLSPKEEEKSPHWKSVRSKPDPDTHQNETEVDKPSKVIDAKKPIKPMIPFQPKMPDPSAKKAPPSAAKPKPPPPKSKPMIPPSKPVTSNASMEEMKEDIKLLKDSFNTMQSEHRREVTRLKEALEEEKKLRIKLQDDLAALQMRLG